MRCAPARGRATGSPHFPNKLLFRVQTIKVPEYKKVHISEEPDHWQVCQFTAKLQKVTPVLSDLPLPQSACVALLPLLISAR